jgi:TldD protein
MARGDLPLPNLREPDIAAALLQIAQRGGEVFVEHRDSMTLRLSSSTPEADTLEARSDRDVGAGVRFGEGGILGYASTNVLTPQGFFDAARVAAESVGQSLDGAPLAADRLSESTRAAPAHRPRRPVSSVDIEAKADALRQVAASAWAVDPRVRDVVVTYVEVVQHVLVMGSTGGSHTDLRTRARVTCRVVARDGRDRGSGFDGPGIGGGFELFDERPPQEIGAAAARRALLQLGGAECRSGASIVVLGPSAGGMLVHEACGHGLEADLVGRETSVFAGTQGKRLAAPHVTIVDDPSLPAGFGSYGMDDEGRPSHRTILIDHGVQVGALTDAASAKLGMAPSANGRRESYAHAPLCRMSNTYLANGTESPAAIIADVSSGVYVARLSGGEVDAATGDFTFTASEAFQIEGGELARPLRAVTLVGNSLQALEAIDAVGDDLSFTQALCGKDDQWVPISYGSPTVRIAELTVTGTR